MNLLAFIRSLTGILGLWLLVLHSECVHASSGITYHGRLLAPDGAPVTSSTVQFRMQIRTPGTEDCLLYEEIQTHDLSTTNGMFALSLGDGSGVRQDSYTWSLFDAFSNRMNFSFSAGDCSGMNTYSPDPGDNRRFRVFFNDGTFAAGTWEALPVQTINFIPMSIESYAVGGFPASSLLRVETAGTLGTTTPLTATQYAEILNLVNGNSSQYEKDGELNGSAIPTLTAGQTVTSDGSGGWVASTPLTSESDPTVEAFAKASLPTCAAGEVLKSDGTSLSCVTDSAGTLPDIVTAGTYSKVTVSAKGLVTAGSQIDGDDITSGTIGGSTSISTTGSISSASLSTRQLTIYDSDDSNFIRFLTPTTGTLTADYTLRFPASDGNSGQVLSTDGSGVLSWISPSTGSVVGVTGTSPISVDNTDPANPVISISGGASPVGSSLSTGEVWVGDGSNQAQERFIGVEDLKTLLGTQQIPTACTSKQTMIWSAVTDVFSCTDISITASQVSDLSTELADYVEVAGDTMTGSLNLPSNGLVVGTNQLAVSGGKVGIGTTNPASLLHVSGGEIRSHNTSNNFRGWSYGHSTGGTLHLTGARGTLDTPSPLLSGDVMGLLRFDGYGDTNNFGGSSIRAIATEDFTDTTAGSSLAFSTTANGSITPSTRMTISHSGDVGVGTSSPLSRVHISDGNAVDSALINFDKHLITNEGSAAGNTIAVAGSSPSYRGVFKGTRSRGTLSAPLAPLANDSVLSFLGAIYDGDSIEATAAVDFKVDGAVSDGVAPQRISFVTSETNTSARTERMTIKANGDVGIGTTDPQAELEVVGTIKATSFEGPLTATSSSTGDGTAASPSMTFTNDSNTGFYSSGADTIGISAGGTKIWDLSSSGIVSPTTGGAAVSTANGTAAAPTFSFAGDTDTGWFRPAADTLAAATAGAERVRIDASGNVGIGTTNLSGPWSAPVALKVMRPSATWGMVIEGEGTNQSDILLHTPGNTANSRIAQIVNGSDLLMIRSLDDSSTVTNNLFVANLTNGNVGIGTTNPAYPLDVFGTIRATGTIRSGGSARFENGEANDYISMPVADDSIRFFSNDVERLSILSNGNIGVGTTNPSQVLHLSKAHDAPTTLLIENTNNTALASSEVNFKNNTGVLGFLGLGSGSYTLPHLRNRLFLQNSGNNAGVDLIANTSTGDVRIYTGGMTTVHERIRVTPSGNVGIGTTSPSNLLHVENSGRSIQSAVSSTAISHQILSDSTTGVAIGMHRPGDSIGNNAVISTKHTSANAGAWTNRFAIDSTTGNICY